MDHLPGSVDPPRDCPLNVTSWPVAKGENKVGREEVAHGSLTDCIEYDPDTDESTFSFII